MWVDKTYYWEWSGPGYPDSKQPSRKKVICVDIVTKDGHSTTIAVGVYDDDKFTVQNEVMLEHYKAQGAKISNPYVKEYCGPYRPPQPPPPELVTEEPTPEKID